MFNQSFEELDRVIPGLPRGSGAMALSGALAGGALTGVALGVSAGPIGARIGAGVGACVALLAYVAVQSPPALATPRRRRRSVVRLVGRVVSSLSMFASSAAAFATGCFIADDGVSAPTTLGMGVFSAILLAAARPWRGSNDRVQAQGGPP